MLASHLALVLRAETDVFLSHDPHIVWGELRGQTSGLVKSWKFSANHFLLFLGGNGKKLHPAVTYVALLPLHIAI